MTRSDLIRWGGLAAMLAGVAFAGFALLGMAAGGPNALLPQLSFALAFGLLAVGFVGFHALQKADYGLIGRVAYYILVVVLSVEFFARLVITLSGSESFYWILDIGTVGVLLGFVLYGVATLRARVLPVWCGVLIIICLPVRIAMFPVDPWGLVVLGVLWLALGYALWSRREAVAAQPSRVR
jgi:hypothetical protein